MILTVGELREALKTLPDNLEVGVIEAHCKLSPIREVKPTFYADEGKTQPNGLPIAKEVMGLWI